MSDAGQGMLPTPSHGLDPASPFHEALFPLVHNSSSRDACSEPLPRPHVSHLSTVVCIPCRAGACENSGEVACKAVISRTWTRRALAHHKGRRVDESQNSLPFSQTVVSETCKDSTMFCFYVKHLRCLSHRNNIHGELLKVASSPRCGRHGIQEAGTTGRGPHVAASWAASWAPVMCSWE